MELDNKLNIKGTNHRNTRFPQPEEIQMRSMTSIKKCCFLSYFGHDSKYENKIVL